MASTPDRLPRFSLLIVSCMYCPCMIWLSYFLLCVPPRNTMRQNPKVLQNPELVRGRKLPSNRLPLLSPPRAGAHARGRNNPAAATNSMDARGRESRIITGRRARQRGFPRRNDLLCSLSSSVERVKQPSVTNVVDPPPRRLLDAVMTSSNEDKKGVVQPPSTVGVSTEAAEEESTTIEEYLRPSKKICEGIPTNVEEHIKSRSSGKLRNFHGSISASVDFLPDSAGSLDATKSLRTPAGLWREGSGLPQDNGFVAEADGSTLAAADGQAARGVPTVEETICQSWKELPWQARLCPRAIEEREDMRRACALEKEVQR